MKSEYRIMYLIQPQTLNFQTFNFNFQTLSSTPMLLILYPVDKNFVKGAKNCAKHFVFHIILLFLIY
jgi:hypothetical protein